MYPDRFIIVVRMLVDVGGDAEEPSCDGNESFLLCFSFPVKIFVSFGEDVIEIVTW